MNASRVFAPALALLLGGCAERQAEFGADPLAEFPGCMFVPAWGHYDDGTQDYMYNEWGRTGTVCTCMNLEELEVQGPRDELNDLAYDECVRISGLYDFDWTDCETFYEEYAWFGIIPAIEDDAWMNQTGLSCGEDDDAELGCVIADDEQPGAPWALLLVYLAIRRRR